MLYFTKMHGIGNDYIYFNCMESELNNPNELAIKLSDRHKGIGGDGIILICKSEIADVRMRMFNLDGSEGKMCGNGIRCVAKYAYDNKITSKQTMTIETLAGIKTCTVYLGSDGFVDTVSVDMGSPILESKLIPVLAKTEKVIAEPIAVLDKTYEMTCVSMGNPHCVVFVDDTNSINIEKIGPIFEMNPIFPDRVNTEFVKVIDDTHLKMRVWERGSGETLACGTGACASVVAATLNGFVKKDTEIEVELLGGSLYILYKDDTVIMRGGATKVFDGCIEENI